MEDTRSLIETCKIDTQHHECDYTGWWRGRAMCLQVVPMCPQYDLYVAPTPILRFSLSNENRIRRDLIRLQ